MFGACLLFVGITTPAAPLDETAAGIDGDLARVIGPDSAVEPGRNDAAVTGTGVGTRSARVFSPRPGPGDPEVGLPEPDRAAVVRGPVFARGAARSGDSLIAASRGRTCAVRPNGRVACWGQDGIRERLSAAAVRDVVSIGTGDHPHQELHVCVLHGDGTVSCWGSGLAGQLGRGVMFNSYLPAAVPGIADAVALAVGSDHTCIVHAAGEVSCWGSGSLGQLGDGTGASASSPQRVPGLAGIEWIDAGSSSNCVIDAAGTLWCWGLSGGAVGTDSFEPVKVVGLPAVASVSIGRDRTCAVSVAGRVYCWPTAESPDPSPITGLEDVVTVAVGEGGVCAVHDDGGVSCWGEKNAAGQLGNGATTPQLQPARVAGIVEAVAVSMTAGSSRGAAHTCVAHENGSYTCWGGNGVGQLGAGTVEARLAPAPVAVPDEIPAHRIPTDPTDLMRAWLDEVVREQEAVFPWLRRAWDHVRDRASAAESERFRGIVRLSCAHSDGPFECEANSMEVAEMTLGTAVHELAHVYDGTTELVEDRAWGAVQLYFAARYPDCFVDNGQQPGSEILADTMTYLVVPTAWLTYYASGCPGLVGKPDREAEEVVRAGLAGDVPDWYTEDIGNGADLWAVLRRVVSASLLANLAEEFGGFCSTDWFGYPLDRSVIPAARTNPFRDGGC